MALQDHRGTISSQYEVDPGNGVALPPPPVGGIFGVVAGALPPLGGAVVGDAAAGGSISASLPALAGTIEAASAVDSVISSGLPTLGGTIVGDVELGPFVIVESEFIDTSGGVTTALLTPPGAKTTADFEPGRIQDDENPTDDIDLPDDIYTEIEWPIEMTSEAEIGEGYEFRAEIEDE